MPHSQKIENISALSPQKRLNYFVAKVSDFEEVWGLFDDGWAQAISSTSEKIFPVWPESDFAKLSATGSWEKFHPKRIELSLFLEKWIPGLEKDGLKVAVFPAPGSEGVILEGKKVADLISNELGQYE
jgi:hypothetical protein